MKDFGKTILNRLLDKYENSVLSKGGSERKLSISLSLKDKELATYCAVDSYDYRSRNDSVLAEYEKNGFIVVKKDKFCDFESLTLNIGRDSLSKRLYYRHNITFENNRQINVDYFKTINHESAYWLGYIQGDGCVSNEIFEITSKDMANLTKANLFIYNGGGMEHWVDTVKDSIKELKYVETSSNIDDKGVDPHFWLSPIKAKKQMENIKNALAEIDAVNADYYNSNYNYYADRLDELDNHFKDVLSKIKNTNVVVTHPAFGHFCEAYSLNQVAIARDEADPKAMSDTIAFIKNNNVKAIFYEDFSSSKLVDSIAKETGAKILTLNPIESLSEEYINAGEDYFSVMESNLVSLTNCLN